MHLCSHARRQRPLTQYEDDLSKQEKTVVVSSYMYVDR